MNSLWYFPLEIIKSRYTKQLCEEWMPKAFLDTAQGQMEIMVVSGRSLSDVIGVGSVLDATGRGYYALSQCAEFLMQIRNGSVKDGDVLYFQDFWTPGIDAIFYALHLHHIKVRAYAMCHAQSVDEYDFTYEMLPWIRHYERGHDSVFKGIFVASSIHKDQLERAGFRAPIYVVGLPIDSAQIAGTKIPEKKQKAVIFSSRLDTEKNPQFMLACAKEFLAFEEDAEWWVTTSADELRSNDPQALERIKECQRNPRFKVFTGLTKAEYYEKLALASVQFNCSKQDYVSWTLLEACAFDDALVYPDFRSFPECLADIPLYDAFSVTSAVDLLSHALKHPARYTTKRPLWRSNLGRLETARKVILNTSGPINVWHG